MPLAPKAALPDQTGYLPDAAGTRAPRQVRRFPCHSGSDQKPNLPLLFRGPIRPVLLVLDVERFRVQLQQVLRRHQRVAFLGVVVVEELEAGKLHRLGDDVIMV